MHRQWRSSASRVCRGTNGSTIPAGVRREGINRCSPDSCEVCIAKYFTDLSRPEAVRSEWTQASSRIISNSEYLNTLSIRTNCRQGFLQHRTAFIGDRRVKEYSNEYGWIYLASRIGTTLINYVNALIGGLVNESLWQRQCNDGIHKLNRRIYFGRVALQINIEVSSIRKLLRCLTERCIESKTGSIVALSFLANRYALRLLTQDDALNSICVHVKRLYSKELARLGPQVSMKDFTRNDAVLSGQVYRFHARSN